MAGARRVRVAELSWERMGRCARLAWEYGVAAFEQAERRRPAVTTGHLLMGVLSEPDCAGGLVLRRLGVDLAFASSIARFELLYGRPVAGGGEGRAGELWGAPHTAEALRAMGASLEEAQKFHSAYPIGTEHILLGLLSAPEGIGCRTLAYAGVDYASALAARDELWGLLGLTE